MPESSASRTFGRRFGRYETLFRIASGGMAEVYAARIVGEGGFEKIVALKRMLPALAEDERFVTMFLDEGRVAALVVSPHVVQTLDLGRAADNSLYLVMELVEGAPLSHLIRSVTRSGVEIDIAVAVEILAQAAAGLSDAHRATTALGEPLGLIHRDISPQNILVDTSGRTRIMDFGVARAVQNHTRTHTGEVKGKIAYFAPEQALGEPLTQRVDIFSLGVVAWEVLAGRRLFKSENTLRTLRRIVREPAPSLLDVRRDVPAELAMVVARALERRPEDRYDSAGELAQALRASTRTAAPREVGEYLQRYVAESLRRLEDGFRESVGLVTTQPAETELTREVGKAPTRIPPSNPPEETSTSRTVTGSWPRVLMWAGVAAVGVLAGYLLLRPPSSAQPLVPTSNPPVDQPPDAAIPPTPMAEPVKIVVPAAPTMTVEAPSMARSAMRRRRRRTNRAPPSEAPMQTPVMQTPAMQTPSRTGDDLLMGWE